MLGLTFAVKLLLWALAKVIGTSCYGDARLTTNIATHSFEVELNFWLGLTARNSSGKSLTEYFFRNTGQT
jgi:hypothetical protein